MEDLLAAGFSEQMLAQMLQGGGGAGIGDILGSQKSYADPVPKSKQTASTKKEFGASIKQEPKTSGYGSYGVGKTTSTKTKGGYGSSMPLAGQSAMGSTSGWGSSTQQQIQQQQAQTNSRTSAPKAMPRGATDIGTRLQAIANAAEHYRHKCKRKILGRKALFRLEEIIGYHLRTGMAELPDRHDMEVFAQLAEQVLLIIARIHGKAKIEEIQSIASPEGFGFFTSVRNRWVLKNLQTIFQRFPCQDIKDRLLDAHHFEKSLHGVLNIISYK